MPYLADAQANLFCRKEQEIDLRLAHHLYRPGAAGGDARSDISPLLYRDGRYGTAPPDERRRPVK